MKKIKLPILLLFLSFSCKLKPIQHNTGDKISKPILLHASSNPDENYMAISDINTKITVNSNELKFDGKHVILQRNAIFLKSNKEPNSTYAIPNEELYAYNEGPKFADTKIFPLYCHNETQKETLEGPPPPTFIVIKRDEQKGLKVGIITRNDFESFYNNHSKTEISVMDKLLKDKFKITDNDIKKWKKPEPKKKIKSQKKPPLNLRDDEFVIKIFSSLISKVNYIKHKNIGSWKVIPINQEPNKLIVMLELTDQNNIAYMIKAPQKPSKSAMLAT
ncbi:MAG: hypothetical protein GY830_04990 [Bacteroidetes bacterium]|nr:hypothetical protein [Bacteroidota bacterium]